LPAQSRLRTLLGLVPACLGFLLVGCEAGSYPEGLHYPERTDPLVIDRAKEDAPDIDRPGEFPKVLFANLAADKRQALEGDPAKVPGEKRAKLNQALDAVFGTPAHPTVRGKGFLDLGPSWKAGDTDMGAVATSLDTAAGRLGLSEQVLAHGSSLYREQCLHCHGLSGDGRGPTSPWINPHPRDYREGKFKFTSTSQSEGERKARKDDLLRTIREGIEGTSMPSFRLYSEDDLNALASYVIHLSMRGETEFQTLKQLLATLGDSQADPVEQVTADFLGVIADRWVAAQDALIKPEGSPNYPKDSAEFKESVKRGFQLFISQSDAGCISCHIDFGRQSAYKYDDWGTIVRPVDLTAGIYRGGRRPIDLFWRIHSGISGSGMTAFGTQLKSNQIWDLVHFLEILPYPQMRAKYDIKLEAQ
jgi:mono/diheme cytochrome c family protein